MVKRIFVTRGFTLLELLVVIAIIGILAAIVVASMSDSRRNARNAAVLSQMIEYQKSLELYYSVAGSYPSNWTGANRNRVACIGVGTNDCLGGVSFGSPPSASFYDEIENALRMHMSDLPSFTQGTFSSPAYSGCAATAAPYTWNSVTNDCSASSYSLWFLLEGQNQDCGRAVVSDSAFGAGAFTLCRLQSVGR